MARKFTKVLALMQSKGGRLELDDKDLIDMLGEGEDGLMYRVASYFSAIRRRAGLEVKAVRNGRKVVAYELVAQTGSDTPTTDAPASPETAA